MDIVNGASVSSKRPSRMLTDLRSIGAWEGRVQLTDGVWRTDWQAGLHGGIFGYVPEWWFRAMGRARDNVANSIACEDEKLVAALLSDFYPDNDYAIRFMCNGSDTLAAAVKLARAFTGRRRILCQGYHGTASAFCPGPSAARPNIGMLPQNLGTLQAEQDAYLPLEWLGDWENHLTECSDDGVSYYPNAPAAVFIECPPVDGGRTEAVKWLWSLGQACKATGTLLVLDEVVTGFRYGPGGAAEYYGITDLVDLFCVGKTLANGYPASAIFGRADVMQQLSGTDAGQVHFSGTFFGEPIGMGLAYATLDQMKREPPWCDLYDIGFYLIAYWNALDLPWKLAGHPTRPVIWPTPADTERFNDLRRHLFANGHIWVSHPLYVTTATSTEDVESLCAAAQTWEG